MARRRSRLLLLHVSAARAQAFEPIREDMARRGWWDVDADGAEATTQLARLAAFAAVPVLGPAVYVAARPPLPDDA